MQYMLMCCIDEKVWAQLPDSTKDKIMREYGVLIHSLVTSGQFRGGGQLRSTSSATTVRMKGGKLALTDGPFAETKEQLGGYYLIDVPNLDDALKWAGKCPGTKTGSVEVRPLNPHS